MLEFINTTRFSIREDVVSALVFAGVVAGNVAPAVTRRVESQPSGALPTDLRRPTNVESVASSLGVAYETAREKLMDLVGAGLLETRPGGFVVSANLLASPAFGRAIVGYTAAISVFVHEMTDTLDPGSDVMRFAPASPAEGAVAVRLATIHVLRSIEITRLAFPEFKAKLIYLLLALHYCSGAGGEAKPPSNRPLAGTASPGATIAELSAFTRLPHETVRRSVLRLKHAGLVRSQGRRALLALDGDVADRWHERCATAASAAVRLVSQMQAAGLLTRSGEREDAADDGQVG